MFNQLKRDPTRTTMLRNRFIAEMIRRFKVISRLINEIFIDDDVLGLINTVSLKINIEKQAWRFHTNPQKVRSFRVWLGKQVRDKILVIDGLGKPWTATYIESAYKQGVIRAYIDAHKEQLVKKSTTFMDSKAQFLQSSFSSQETISKIELLYERAFTELEGVTAAMDQQMSRILAGGLADGKSPRTIARRLRDGITRITNTRAKVIARTEIIRAHAEGQLDSFETMGIKELRLMAEWDTAGDEKVCILCGEIEGVVMTIKEARGLLPRHPNCRCSWIPANIGESRTGQLWGKRKDKAVEKSILAEHPGTSLRSAKKRSVWAGKEI